VLIILLSLFLDGVEPNLLYRQECFSGKQTTRKAHAKLHPGLQWRIFHILTSEDIDEAISRTKIYSQTRQESSLILARKPFSWREWNGTKRDTKFVSLCDENETFVLLLSEREFG